MSQATEDRATMLGVFIVEKGRDRKGGGKAISHFKIDRT